MLGDSVRRRRGWGRTRSTPSARGDGRGRGARFWVPAVLGALTLPFVLGYLVAVLVLFPRPAMAEPGIPVPDLGGMTEVEVRMALVQAGLGNPEISTLPQPDVEPGVVVAQAPLPGQQLRAGAGVRVAVSSGAPVAPIPDVRGFDAGRAATLLQRLGYVVDTTTVESSTPAEQVLAVQPEPGTAVRVPSRVTLVVSLGPADPQPVGVPWDTLRPALPDTAALRPARPDTTAAPQSGTAPQGGTDPRFPHLGSGAAAVDTMHAGSR